MLARRVCRGTRPSRSHSRRDISEPPRRPLTCSFTPLAPARIERMIVCFSARRKAMRFSSCDATFSATSVASSSGVLISWMVTRTFLPLMRSSSSRSASTDAPCLPMTMPGLAVWITTVSWLALRSVSMRATPALRRRPVMSRRIARSSCRSLVYSLSAYQRASQLRYTPSRNPIGLTFWPISAPLPGGGCTRNGVLSLLLLFWGAAPAAQPASRRLLGRSLLLLGFLGARRGCLAAARDRQRGRGGQYRGGRERPRHPHRGAPLHVRGQLVVGGEGAQVAGALEDAAHHAPGFGAPALDDHRTVHLHARHPQRGRVEVVVVL